MEDLNIVDQEQTEVAEQETAEQEANQTEAVRAAFNASIESGADEDATKMAMIASGASFKNVTRLYNQFMIDAGLAISKADRNALVEEALEGREFESEEDFNSAVATLVEQVKGATERSAAALVRSYAKKNELAVYVKPKGEGARPSFASSYYDFLAANPRCTKEEAIAFIQGEGDHDDTSDNIKKHQSHYLAIHNLVARIVEAA